MMAKGLSLKLLILALFAFIQTSTAQLRDKNFLVLDQSSYRFKTDNGASGTKGFFIYDTKFSFSNDLFFVYYDKVISAKDCCSYMEIDSIPKSWNVIKLEDIVRFLERKKDINPFEKKLFFIERDSSLKKYKVYQVELRKSWLLD